jgi:O-antigen biosynthesis protein WbqV
MTHGADDAPLAGIDWDAITGRPPLVVDEGAVVRRVRGRAVAVTGAAGSLGSPLARALARAGPARLVLLDHHESSLFRLRQTLGFSAPGVSLRAVLADVRDRRLLGRVLGEERPELLFHLAAYKHVPWGEEDPEAFAAANVLGARNVVEAAGEAGAGLIVYPSTDKAIDPPSLYGATKRLAEALLRAAAGSGGPRSAIVRFVNVLGSQGSAPETFARQIRAGRPLSVTDQRMRRYWITPQHANLLLLHAACLESGPQGTVTVAPDAGEEITILDIARRLFRALAPQAGEPAIRVTGVRPGERLSEPLAAPHERLVPAPLSGLLIVRGVAVPPAEAVQRAVRRTAALLADGAGPEAIREALFCPL